MLDPSDPILIVGAGASGLISAKALISEGFDNITIVERRHEVGGVWLYDDDYKNQDLQYEKFPSPMYDNLVGNIWYKLLELESHTFPEGITNFPTRQQMQTYLLEYAEELRPMIQLHRNVLSVDKHDGQWSVVTQLTSLGGETDEHKYKAVILSCGIYDTPDQPDIPGLAEWQAAYPDQVVHSKTYRSPEVFSGQRLLIMGNGPSGIDCAAQCADHARTPIYRTIHGPPEHAVLPDDRIKDLPAVASFEVKHRCATLIDGQVIDGLDKIIISTGYRHSYPFLTSLNATSEPLVTNGARVHNLYQHIFYQKDPTLAFIGLLIAAIPFPISEAQALVAARVYSGRLQLPSRDIMRKNEQARLAEVGDTYKFHKMRYPLDADYGDEMRQWCLEARPRKTREKLPVAWTEERRRWRRLNLELKVQQLSEARAQKQAASNGNA